jgi:FHS family L-fucose permease-like MFS transporter
LGPECRHVGVSAKKRPYILIRSNMTRDTAVAPISRSKYIVGMTVIAIFFFIFGFVTWLNGILIPFLRTACELTDFQAYFVTTAFYISYFVMSLPSSALLKRTGFRNGMSIGLWVMAAGALIFIPAALARNYGIFLFGLFVQGTGMALLQTASNPYVTIIGPRESAAKRISVMGIANKFAGAIAPIILGAHILKDSHILDRQLAEATNVLIRSEILDQLAARVINPYIIMAVILGALGLLLRFAHLPEVDTEAEEPHEGQSNANKTSIWHFPHMIMGAVALFFYVGVEVIAGDTIIRYGQSLSIDMSSAKYFTSLTMLGMIIGYICGIIFIPRVLSQVNALRISAILGIVFSFGAIFSPSSAHISMPFRDLVTFDAVTLTIPVTVLFVALLGLANALVWPSIWPLALNGVGRFTKTASALLVMSVVGGALIPLAYGKMADIFNTQAAYWVCLPSYIILLYYSLHGYRLKGKR